MLGFRTDRPERRRPGLVLPVALLGIALLAAAPGALAQSAPTAKAEDSRGPQPGLLSLLPPDSVTQHELQTDDGAISYTATAGTFILRGQDAKPLAGIVYTAYTRDDAGDAPTERPVTFAFNGGPGAASTYLHLGLVGPQVADFGTPPAAATARLHANPESWLRFTDLVLIDPVGTGWSRAADPDGNERFWSVDGDAEALAKVVALYTAQNNRTASPKYLLGESYGGFRAAKVARSLQQRQGLVVDGIVMLSPLLDAGLTFRATRSALSAALLLPAIAATELDRQGRFTPEALAAAEEFAMSDYLVALAGPPLSGAAATAFYGRVAEITGLSQDVVARTRGFVGRVYLSHPRDDGAEVVSPYDGTFTMADPFPETDYDGGDDPILDGFLQSLGGLFVGYARTDLGFETEMTYELLNRRISGQWNWDGGRRGASVTGDLRRLLALNPGLRVLIAHGRSDLVTPYGPSRYVLDHLAPDAGAERARLTLYKGGHMFYLDPASRRAFTEDAEAFYRREAP